MSEQKWEPIESAPKDGSEILVWGTVAPAVARWEGASWEARADGDSAYDFYDARMWLYPTHWMPLPPPPHD